MVNYIGSSFCLLPQYCQFFFLSHCMYIISYMCMADNITVVSTCTIVYYTCSLHCGCKLLASTFFSIVLFRYCFYSSQHYCYMTERYRYMYTCRLLKSLKNSGVCLFLEVFFFFTVFKNTLAFNFLIKSFSKSLLLSWFITSINEVFNKFL